MGKYFHVGFILIPDRAKKKRENIIVYYVAFSNAPPLINLAPPQHTHKLQTFFQNPFVPFLQIPFDESAIRKVKTPLTRWVFAQTSILLGQVVLNRRVSYRHITAVGD